MTVKELIEALQHLPNQNAVVLVHDPLASGFMELDAQRIMATEANVYLR